MTVGIGKAIIIRLGNEDTKSGMCKRKVPEGTFLKLAKLIAKLTVWR